MKRFVPALLLLVIALACMAATGPSDAAQLASALIDGCDSTRTVVSGDTTSYQTLECTLQIDTTYHAHVDTLVDTTAIASWVTDSTTVASVIAASGRPFGPFGLMDSWTSYVWGPAPFTTSIGANAPSGVCVQIATARAAGMKLVLGLAMGAHSNYKSGGKFDVTKWKNKVANYNTATIKNCIAAGVSDGTVIGNAMIDEPENTDWGGNITKTMLDGMATYAQSFFPTLPEGVNHGAGGYRWLASDKFKVVDYVNYQYRWSAANSKGNAALYRDAVLAQSAYDGVATSFSLNLLAGGREDKSDGKYDCTGTDQYGIVTDLTVNWGLCRMTPARVKEWGEVFVKSQSCALLAWTYSQQYWSAAGVVDAFKYVAGVAKTQTARSCKRP
jgi:hypothetical protein